MITLFTANGRLILDVLSKGSKYYQDYSIDDLIPALNQVRTGNARLRVAPTLILHMDNSISRNGTKITAKMLLKRLRQVSHPAYSPDISPCDFWVFETIKGMIKNRHLHGPEEILRAIQEAWSHFTFEDFQNVFKSWMERRTWVIANNEEYCHYKSRLESDSISGL
jgi:histone-lysine N-methyltransferase SETMAR